MASLIPPHIQLVDVVEDHHHGEDSLPDDVKQGGHKVVYFVRHGQSEANVASDNNHPDFRDAPLTRIGHEQAMGLQSAVKKWGVQTVYCSPLTRAIQTACIAFAEEKCPIYAWPVITEFYPDMPECQGRNRQDLKSCLMLSALSRFDDVRLDGVADNWWHIAGDRVGRLRTFFNWLSVCPETRIAIVCHWGFINETLNVEARSPLSLQIRNCCSIRTIWSTTATLPSPTLAHLTMRRTYGVVALPSSGGASPLAQQLFTQLQNFVSRLAAHPKLSNLSCLRYHRLPFIHLASLGHIPNLTQVSQAKDVLRRELRRRPAASTHAADAGTETATTAGTTVNTNTTTTTSSSSSSGEAGHARGEARGEDVHARRFHLMQGDEMPEYVCSTDDEDTADRVRVLYRVHNDTLSRIAAAVVAFVQANVVAADGDDDDGDSPAAPRRKAVESEPDDDCVVDWCARHGASRLVVVDDTAASDDFFRPQGSVDLSMVMASAHDLPLVSTLLHGPDTPQEVEAAAGVSFSALMAEILKHMEWELCLVSLTGNAIHTEGVFAL
ncbi:hypothetical protein PTSG_05999 [Salpingoeca rosetta]|uniref:Phosphoglycerate mutase n=1 Tax=Salpingoeca rosetta (strain ATCC 50818 / BSB-021) TaxID=946362 RepID=F2UDE0_SALR5|nr:uncharacterized protein PTSG_05999 [Salpingoeca rosetta]EGD74635.1 hypothetical protein PTSG_05999 [Salpingoeca rosetta]|eukprot:XP_004992892.1 hypothetical protein PTSG_05999 [Salpingoeca rosetta]